LPDSLSANIRACLCRIYSDVDGGVPDQRAGQISKFGDEQVALVGVGRVGVTFRPSEKRSRRSCQTPRILNILS
jgi:hypothetical protein